MTKPSFPLSARVMVLLAAALLFAAVPAAYAAQPKTSAKKTAVAKPAGEVVEYETLEGRVGQEVVIETTLKTVRRGTLIKWTQPGLTVQLGPESGSIELSVPRETIKTITVFAPAAPTDNQGKSGAKEN